MKIKLFSALLLLSVVSVCKLNGQNPPSDATTAAKNFLQALTDENSSALDQLLGRDFVLLSFDGQLVDASTLIDGISGGYVVIDSGNTYSNYTRNYQDTGIVTGIWDVRGSIQGQSFGNRLSYTIVSVKQGGAWKVVSVQFTPS